MTVPIFQPNPSYGNHWFLQSVQSICWSLRQGGDWNGMPKFSSSFWDPPVRESSIFLVALICLVGADWNHGILNDFPIILGRIIPTDEVIFFRGVGMPPTSIIWCFPENLPLNQTICITKNDCDIPGMIKNYGNHPHRPYSLWISKIFQLSEFHP